MVRMELRMTAAHIALFKALVESYDNLATLRTADPATHRLHLWYWPAHQAQIEALLAEVVVLGPIEVIELEEGGEKRA